MFQSYDEALDTFSRARSKSAGKPIGTHLRMYLQPDSTLLIRNYDSDLCSIQPNNTITFVMSNEILCKRYSLSSQLQYVGSFGLKRKSKYLYAIRTQTGDYEYFSGIRFDMANGRCHNPRAPMAQRINNDKRLEWLRKLRAFKHQIKLMNKLGVLETLIKTTEMESVAPDTLVDLMYEAIRDKVTVEAIRSFIAYVKFNYDYRNTLTPHECVDHIFKLVGPYNGLVLRQRFNVYRED